MYLAVNSSDLQVSTAWLSAGPVGKGNHKNRWNAIHSDRLRETNDAIKKGRRRELTHQATQTVKVSSSQNQSKISISNNSNHSRSEMSALIHNTRPKFHAGKRWSVHKQAHSHTR